MTTMVPAFHAGGEYVGGWKYVTTGPTTIQTTATYHRRVEVHGERGRAVLTLSGEIQVSAAFGWDGPSGPAIDTASFMRASLAHDVLYWFMREGALPQGFRATADRVMRELALEDGMPRWRAWYTWAGVRIGAASAARG